MSISMLNRCLVRVTSCTSLNCSQKLAGHDSRSSVSVQGAHVTEMYFVVSAYAERTMLHVKQPHVVIKDPEQGMTLCEYHLEVPLVIAASQAFKDYLTFCCLCNNVPASHHMKVMKCSGVCNIRRGLALTTCGPTSCSLGECKASDLKPSSGV